MNAYKDVLCLYEEEQEMKLEIIKVIKTETVEGTGTEKDPVRTVVRYWDENGTVIAEKEKSLLFS